MSDETVQFSRLTVNDLKSFYQSSYPTFDDKVFDDLISKLDLPRKKPLSQFSKGMKRQAIVACALASRTKYILLDEAFDGLDPAMRRLIRTMIVDDIFDRGATLIVSSHNVTEIGELCDKAMLLHKGEVIFAKDIDDVRENFEKVQIALPDGELDRTVIENAGVEVLSFKTLGRVSTVITKGDKADITAKVNKLLFVITNLVLFMNFIMQMSIRKFITHYIESETNYYEGYAIAYVCIAAIALCAVFTVFTLFRELFSKPHADLAYSLPVGAKERFFSKLLTLLKLHILPVIFWNIIQFIAILLTTDITLNMLARYSAVFMFLQLSTSLFVILAVLLCMICCGRLAEMLYTAVIITACEVALPACIHYSTINPYTVQYLYDLENFFNYCPVWSALPAKLMDLGYSTNLLLLLIGSTIFSALLITLLYFLYKKRDGKDTGKPFVFSAYREIILILAVVTVTTYVLSDTSNLILLPSLFLSYLLVRILSSNRKLTIVRFVKWVGIFAVYMIVIFGVNILAYFCDGFTGKINGSRLSDANRVCVMNSTSDGVTFHYLSDTLSKDEAMQIIYIYNKALDTRKKSFADYIDHFKPHEISPNSVGVAIDVYTSKDDHTNLDFIDVSFEVTNAEVDNVTEKLKSLSFVEPEQTSYAY